MRWGVRTRLLLAVMAPASLLALLLTGILAIERLGWIQGSLHTAVQATARQWAAPVTRALSDGDAAALDSIAASAARAEDIATVRILRPDGSRIAAATIDPNHGLAAELGLLLLSMTQGKEFQPPQLVQPLPTAANAPAARMEIVASAASAGRRFFAALLLPAVAIAAVLAGAVVLAAATATSIATPLRRLRRHVDRLGAEDLDTPLGADSDGELGELERAIDDMADAQRARRERLEQQVSEATTRLRQTLHAVEVQNVELDVARKRALEASQVKSEFLANVSHEIRTPINGIVGFADLLQHSPLDSEQRDHVNVIRESCTNLLTIVNDILDFSKIEAGKLVIDNVAFNLRDSVEDVLSLLAPAAYGKNLELIHLIYADVPLKLCGDPLRIRQVLTNLVHNAIKFTSAGHVVVRVMLDDDSERHAMLRVTVTDTGIGLSDDARSRLFKAFSQADTSLTRRFSGTGLGLIISKKLVEQMGGAIGLESEPGKGSTFWFTLRCQKRTAVRHDDDGAWHNPLRGRRALLHDPEPLSRLATQHLLEAWNMEVTETEDSRAFLSLASAGRRYDIIVIGLNRAGLDGSLCKSVLPRVREFAVPVLAMASTVDRRELRMLYRSGANVCLPKAVRRQTIFRELCRLIAPGDAAAYASSSDDAVLAISDAPLPPPRPGEDAVAVLVVDDNAINRKLGTTIASRFGAHVSEAEDGRAAVEACRGAHFDVIFMDIHMPDMSGVAAAQEIRRLYDSEASMPRIVALTANAMPGERERLLANGMDDCLIKPVTEAQMTAVLSGHTPEPGSTEVSDETENPLYAEMRDMLIAELPGHRRALRRAYRGGDMAALKGHVHKLHGAVSVCRLPQLKEACQVLENDIVTDNRIAVPGGMERVMVEIAALLGREGAAPDAEPKTRA